jgi:cytochrome o ubiquinol oxidase operon protein cyoD
MSQHSQIITAGHKPKNGTLTSYTIGYLLSIVLTVLAYFLVVQLVVQLLFFLHLGQESRPRWHLLVFLMMIGFVAIIVVGSIWIMKNLDYNMQPEDVKHYITEEERISR